MSIRRSTRTVNRGTLQARIQERVDALQTNLEELGVSRYPNSPLLGQAHISGDRTTVTAAGIAMQIQALGALAESFGIYLRYEALQPVDDGQGSDEDDDTNAELH